MIDLKELIKYLETTQKSFADAIGYDAARISRIAKGRDELTPALRDKIIEVYGDKAKEFFDRWPLYVFDPEPEYRSLQEVLKDQLEIKDRQIRDQSETIEKLLKIIGKLRKKGDFEQN